MSTGFVSIATNLFRFLESDYGYVLESTREEFWGGEVTYVCQNNSVGVRLVYEFSHAFVFVFIYRLVGGVILENKFPITDESTITCIDFNDILDEPMKMKPAYEYGDKCEFFDETSGLRNYVKQSADRLRQYGNDLLSGDFIRFSVAEKAIKARANAVLH
jgi:hypothetical protein